MPAAYRLSGDSGIRTHDLLNAIQALSQLSYTPIWSKTLYLCGFPAFYFIKSVSSLRGRTPDISLSQLSYTPMTAIIAKSKKNCN